VEHDVDFWRSPDACVFVHLSINDKSLAVYANHQDAEQRGIYFVFWFGPETQVANRVRHGIKTQFQEFPVVTTTENHTHSHLSSRFGRFMVSFLKTNTGTTAIVWYELNPCGFQYLTKCP
jgi:hypothetical protein